MVCLYAWKITFELNHDSDDIHDGPKKLGLLLTVDNFATVRGRTRKAYDVKSFQNLSRKSMHIIAHGGVI